MASKCACHVSSSLLSQDLTSLPVHRTVAVSGQSVGVLHFTASIPCSQVLVAFLTATPDKLGYVPLPTPAPFSVSDQMLVDNLMPLAGIPNVRPVYTAQFCGREVVVKLSNEAQVQREVRPATLAHKEHVCRMSVRCQAVLRCAI